MEFVLTIITLIFLKILINDIMETYERIEMEKLDVEKMKIEKNLNGD
jgi:hypothetical protein